MMNQFTVVYIYMQLRFSRRKNEDNNNNKRKQNEIEKTYYTTMSSIIIHNFSSANCDEL